MNKVTSSKKVFIRLLGLSLFIIILAYILYQIFGTHVSNAPLGQPTDFGNLTLQVEPPEITDSFGKLKAASGNRLVAVQMSVRVNNIGKRKYDSIYSSYAILVDAQNYGYTSLEGKEPVFRSKPEVRSGETVSGWLTFEVPANTKGLALQYGNADAVKQFNLGDVPQDLAEPPPDRNYTPINYNSQQGSRSLTVHGLSKEGNQLAVEITVKSQAGPFKILSIYTNDFIVKAANGNSFKHAVSNLKYPFIATSSYGLLDGMARRGWLTFEVPANTTNLVLEYNIKYGVDQAHFSVPLP